MLRNFAGDCGRLFAFDRRSPTRGVFHAPPHKIFFEKDLYAALLPDGTKDVSLEHGFGSLESAGSALFQRLIGDARRQLLTYLSPNDRRLLDGYTYFQWKRVPESINRAVERAELDRIAREVMEQFEANVRPISNDERQMIESSEGRRRTTQTARRNAIASGSAEIMRAFHKLTANVAHITASRRAFLVGSVAVTKLNSRDDSSLSAPATELWMPIPSDVAVVYANNAIPRCFPLSDAHGIRHINEAIAMGSNIIASRSQELTASLSSLVGRRIDKIGLLRE